MRMWLSGYGRGMHLGKDLRTMHRENGSIQPPNHAPPQPAPGSPASAPVFSRRLTHGLARIEDAFEYPGNAPGDPPRREILGVRWEQVRPHELPDGVRFPPRALGAAPRRLALLTAACSILALLMFALQLGR